MPFRIEHAPDVHATLERLVADVLPWATRGSSVFVKPNLTYSQPMAGVTTSPAVLEALIVVLKDLGVSRICVGEGEGGYNTFRMSDTLARCGGAGWERKYGIEVAVVNDWPSAPIVVDKRHHQYTAHFPRALLDDFDGLITVPVPKVHAMTVMSCAVKNQWGLVQDSMRLRLHLALPEILYELHTRLGRVGVIVDGTFGLTRSGPMLDGVPLDLGWIAASSDVWTADTAVAGIMRIDVKSVPYLKYALEQGAAYEDVSAAWRSFEDDRFYLRLNVWNRLARLTWHSRFLNNLVYFSRVSTLLHRLMYKIRPAPADISLRGRDWT